VKVKRNRSSGFLVSALVLGGLVSWASADWPHGRRDPRRTAQATGTSDIVQPVAYWKRYIGGEIDPAAFLVADVDADGAVEVLMIAGGNAVAKTRTDKAVWRSANLELVAFVGVTDVDGDEREELVARSNDRTYVLSLADGSVLWAQPAGELGTIGGARLGDVDGDGLSDLLVIDCVCCQVTGSNAGFVYSFAAGAAAPTRLWQFPFARCGGGPSLTLVDADGVAPFEVLLGDASELVLLSGADGAELARTPSLGTRVQRSRCTPSDIVGGRSEELVCVYDADDDPLENERKVFALRYRPSVPRLEVMWSVALAPVNSGALAWLDLLSDLDGDGTGEVVISALTDGAWTTHVLDAATGATIDRAPGELVMGTAPTDQGAILLTSSASHLSGWSLAGSSLVLDWTVLDAVVLPSFDMARSARTSIATTAALAQVDDDATPDVITVLRSQPGTLVGYHVSTDAVDERARYMLPPSVTPVEMWPILSSADPDLLLAVASNDGFLTLFDRHLSPALDKVDDVTEARLTIGGYYASGWRRVHDTPRSAVLDGDVERILLVDSRRSMLVLDASLGSFAAPPRIMWEVPEAAAPVVVERLADSGPGVVCWAVDQPATTPPTYSILALDGQGQTLWREPAPVKPINDIVAGNFDGNGVPDLVFQWGDPGDVLLRTRAISGATGATLWDSAPVDPGAGRQPAGVAVGDFDGDGLDDVYHQVMRTEVLSGADGSPLARSDAGPNYFLPTLVDLDSEAAPEVILHGGADPLRILDHDLGSTLFQSNDDNRPYPYGAVADCGEGRQVFIEGSNLNPARLKLHDLSGGAAGQERTLVLAGGLMFPDETQAAPTVTVLGQLTSATVHQNLTGQGRPSAVVGSTDGWLYAIDPCSGALDFSYSFGAPVGEAIFGDSDGDGRDEIIVSAADGYVYTLRNFEIDQPGEVLDTDPWSDATGDIAEINTISTLEATWSPVDGATGYEVAVVDREGNYLGEPWRPAGQATSLLLEDLDLVDGATYRVSVRSISGSGGRSVDRVSNGVWVHLLPDPPDGGCCNAGGRGGLANFGSGLLLLAVVGLLRRFRRRR
jgi:hypothetical protein